MKEKDVRVVETLNESQIVQLHALVGQQWWGTRRSLDEIQEMLKHTSLMIGLVEDSSDRLVGFCRLLTDFVFRATIYDVMVDRPHQGAGLGRMLMDLVDNHPRLQRVNCIYLCCEEKMYPFYERWGYLVYAKQDLRTRWMIKIQHQE